MFMQLGNWFQQQFPTTPPPQPLVDNALRVFGLHPMQISRFLEEVWVQRASPVGGIPPNVQYPALEVPAPLFSQEADSGIDLQINAPTITVPTAIYPIGAGGSLVLWDHLIYAYLIENTRMYEIFEKVLREFIVGERLEIASPEGQQWLRTTEDLFYHDTPPFNIFSLTSWIRPDIRASRRTAYYRMFGMDLNHGRDGGGPYTFLKPSASNIRFVELFESFLQEVWVGIENANNTAGPNATDDEAIANYALQLRNMLNDRRRNGNLSREELFYVSTMSWFHLTVNYNSPIVSDLRAEATTPEERLFKVGQRVGLPAHSRSHSYFQIAQTLSGILWDIEAGQYDTPAAAGALYLGPPTFPANPVRDAMETIITHWSVLTGRNMKARSVRVIPGIGAVRGADVSTIARSTAPVNAPPPLTGAGGNGRMPTSRETSPV